MNDRIFRNEDVFTSNRRKGLKMTATVLAMFVLLSPLSVILLDSELVSLSGADVVEFTVDDVKGNKIRYKIIPETDPNTVEVVANKENKYSGDIVIPEYVTYQSIKYDVISIGGGAFEERAGLTSIDIGSVTTIGDYAFFKCTGLKDIDLSSVTTIGRTAFAGCTGLKDIDLSSVTTIGDTAFSDCTSLESIDLGSVESIGYGAFIFCTDLKSITIPPSVTSIGDWMFGDCTSLESITIPSSVTTICDRMFENCTSLESITIPSSVMAIGNGAFENCTSLKVAVLPSSLILETETFPAETILLMNDNNDVIIHASKNGEKIEMVIDPGVDTIVESVIVTYGNYDPVDVDSSEGKWMFIPVQEMKEFKLNIVTAMAPDESEGPSDGDKGNDGFWTTINIMIVVCITTAILGLLCVFVIRRL